MIYKVLIIRFLNSLSLLIVNFVIFFQVSLHMALASLLSILYTDMKTLRYQQNLLKSRLP